MSNDIMCIVHKDKECRMGDCQFFEILPLGRTWMRVCNFQAKKERFHSVKNIHDDNSENSA